MKLSDKIWVCRKKAGLSQEALAEKIGVSRQAISKWETGEAAPEITKLPLLARTFQVTADWLLDDEAGFEEDAPEEDAAPEEPVGATIDRPSPEPVQTYPEWIDHLPGFLGRMLKKYGWIFGVRMAISGALFIVMGLVANAMFTSMDNSFNGMVGGMFPATQNAGVTFFDEAGNMVDPGQLGLTDSDLAAMGLGGYSPFGGISMTAGMTEPFDIFCGFIIVLGVVQLAGGLFLAWYLKKKGQESL
ncbi:MAG: helix-turn-helix transcriptional regulator [Clostridia bacterium]|nr:helix-turn-helix transcriptional regulator [Clostridia bacterium]